MNEEELIHEIEKEIERMGEACPDVFRKALDLIRYQKKQIQELRESASSLYREAVRH